MSDRVKKNMKLALIFTIYTVLMVTLDGSIVKMLFNYIFGVNLKLGKAIALSLLVKVLFRKINIEVPEG